MALYIDNIRKQQGRLAAMRHAVAWHLTRTRPGELLIAGWRRRRLRQFDALILSYPKCGRTWVRLILSKILVAHFQLPEPADPFDLESLADSGGAAVPRIRVAHDDDAYLKAPGEQRAQRSEYRDSKVILLVRDPRDVLVSNYFQAGRRHGYFKGSLSEFVRSPLGAPSLLRYLQIWRRNQQTPTAFLLVRYEDMADDTVAEITRILQFLTLDIDPATVQQAVDDCAFEKMQRMERNGALASGRLTPGNLGDPESFKVRRGKVGGYTEYLSPEDIAYIESLMERDLPGFFPSCRRGAGNDRRSTHG